MTTTTVRKRRTKAEIQKEFDLMSDEVRQSVEQLVPSEEKSNELRKADVLARAESVTCESVVQSLATLGLEVTKVFAGLSEKITTEVRQLSELREAVSIKKEELARLHKVDIAACALEQLIEEHNRKKQESEEALNLLQTELHEQQIAQEAELKEYDAALKKARQREVEEYEYKKALERKKAQDKYDEEQRLLERTNREKQADLEKAWKAREATLKGCEEELVRLRNESTAFTDKLKKETEKAVAEALKAAEHKYANEMLLLQRDADTEKRLAELKIHTLEDTASRQVAQMEILQKRLEEAKQQVENIALKAIDGASNFRALDRVNAIAMEQAKNRTSGGV